MNADWAPLGNSSRCPGVGRDRVRVAGGQQVLDGKTDRVEQGGLPSGTSAGDGAGEHLEISLHTPIIEALTASTTPLPLLSLKA